MGAFQEYHQLYVPASVIWSGDLPFRDHVFAGGGMFREASIRRRQSHTEFGGGRRVCLWVRRSEQKKKLETEGAAREANLLGFAVDHEEGATSPPAPKILRSVNLVNSPEFGPGCRPLDIRGLQELRGSVTHRPNAGHIWKFRLGPPTKCSSYVTLPEYGRNVPIGASGQLFEA